MYRAVRATLACLVLTLSAAAATAQPLSFGQIEGPSLVILNPDRVFSESLFGQRFQSELEAASSALAAQNRDLEASLLEEEQSLTEQRATMSAEAFAPLAQEFDSRVEGIRTAQAERLRVLSAAADRARQMFVELTTPILRDLLRERGATAVIDSRAVIYAVEAADITQAALERINAVLGDGGEESLLDQIIAAEEADAPADGP